MNGCRMRKSADRQSMHCIYIHISQEKVGKNMNSRFQNTGTYTPREKGLPEKLSEETYVMQADKVIQSLKNNNGRFDLTTSKIRKILAMNMDIYNEVMCTYSEKLEDSIKGKLEYFKIRIIYECGRDDSKVVKTFVDRAGILKYLDNIKGNRREYVLFCRYMEALVAYHRYYGGRDK